jgi:MFS family permease
MSTLLILFLAGSLGLTAGWIGLYMSIGAVGGLLGASMARRLADRYGQGPTMVGVFLLTTPLMFSLPLARPGWSTWLAAVCSAVAGAGITVWNIIQRAFRQQLTPPEILGRAQATARFVAWGLMPLAAVLSGVAGHWFGLRPTITVCVVGTLLSILPLVLSPLRGMRTLTVAEELVA